MLLGAGVFWRVHVSPPTFSSGAKICDIVSSVARVHDKNLGLGRVNTILGGIGRVERSPYVVVGDPLVVALDFFRHRPCDLDWVKQQVYGRRLLHVPENFL